MSASPTERAPDYMAFEIIGTLHVIVLEKDPSARDWALYVDALRAEESRGVPADQMRTIVFSDGGGPNTAQRKVLNELLAGRSSDVAIVTDNLMMRGVITALRWFNPRVRAFAPHDVTEALVCLGIPATRHGSIRETALALQASLGLRLRALGDVSARSSHAADV